MALAGAGVLAAAGCGPVQLGQPPTYTPPPPGIDDLYRTDLLMLIDRANAAVEQLRPPASGGAPSDGGGASDAGGGDAPPVLDVRVADALAELSSSLPVQRTALLTGAQLDRESEQAEDPDPHLDPPPPPTHVPSDVAGLVGVLVELRDLCVDAARQVSGSLARPVCAIGAHTTWAALRLRAASGQGEVPAPPPAQSIEPTRPVPSQDPPSIGAESDYHAYIETAQQEEWYAAYVHEVLAASTEGSEREGHLTAMSAHRTRAESLHTIAEEDGAPTVPRQAVYALPGGTPDPGTAAQLPTMLADALLVAHVALVGAAPFERRALSIEAALTEAGVLAGLVGRLDPLPSLAPEGLPDEE
nr:DUF4439 domain-containing protein [Brachybacterium muris]